MSGIVCKGAYYLLVDPVELYHKLVMELFQGQNVMLICYVEWVFCLSYDFEMDRCSAKRGEAKVPIIPDRRPCLNDGFMGLVLPVAERRYCAEGTHCPLLLLLLLSDCVLTGWKYREVTHTITTYKVMVMSR